MRTFFVAFLQIGCISAQVIHISRGNYIGALITTVLISCCWILNTNAVIRKGFSAKLQYVVGAALGTLTSMFAFS